MISSMTAFSNIKTEFEHGTLLVELRCVNNRYLDLSLRIPEDFKVIEEKLRELIAQHLQRGKAELKITFKSNLYQDKFELEANTMKQVAQEIDKLRQFFPDMPTPSFAEIMQLGQSIQSMEEASEEDKSEEAQRWQIIYDHCLETVALAIKEFIAMRLREGARLAETMSGYANQILKIVSHLESQQESLVAAQKEKIHQRLAEALQAVAPNGFEQISGEELSMRIAQETSLFGIRVDIAEEITRLKSHTSELKNLLAHQGEAVKAEKNTKNKQSLGRRLDFLFQEMNREINTIGSKSASLDNTQAVIDMKLYVEQLREQALNIE
ncbi:MAG: YicC/YloC family endoribonuclease [Alcaligenaceae bacterium]|nr:YicC/YloC family endoribonuclease [Alcaligenaceae bacterium]